MGDRRLQQVTEIGGDAIVNNTIGSGGGEHRVVRGGKKKEDK